jgi:CP family cyanate transporter-like MFS transporter
MAIPAQSSQMQTPTGERRDTVARIEAILLVVGITLLSLNQRPALVAVGPVTEQIRRDTGLSASATSLLTTLPLICLGVFAALAPAFARRLGLDRAIGAALLTLALGIVVRIIPTVTALFVGSVIAGIGIAVMNVLVPALVKRDFSHRIGLMTAVYTLMLNGGAGLAAAVTIPVGHSLHLDWRATLGLWGLLTIPAITLWVPRMVRARADGAGRTGDQRVPQPWRSGLAWAVAAFMGMQSLLFYTLIAWLPTILQNHGYSEAAAGMYASVVSLAGIVASFTTPLIAVRASTLRVPVVVIASLFLTGLVGLLVAPTTCLIAWTVALGLAQGGGLSIAMMMFVLRARTAQGSAALSGMAQTVGYLVAATGPLAAGALHDLTHSWSAPLIGLVCIVAVFGVAGWTASANRTIEDSVR